MQVFFENVRVVINLRTTICNVQREGDEEKSRSQHPDEISCYEIIERRSGRISGRDCQAIRPTFSGG